MSDTVKMYKRIISLILVFLLAFQPINCMALDIGRAMQNLFTQLGGLGNVNTPGVYKGQTMGVVTGGSLYMRAPSRSLGMVGFRPPSIKAGCGGIDMFNGSIGFGDSRQIVEFLKSIGSSLLGLAFQLAIDAVSALIGVNIKHWMDQLRKFLNQSINSCEIAETMIGKGNESGLYQSVTTWASQNSLNLEGSVRSFAEGMFKVREGNQAAEIINAKAADPATSPQIKAQLPIGNVFWDCAKKSAVFSDDDRELLMSIVGTYVIKPADNNPEDPGNITSPIIPYGPKVTSVLDILKGKTGGADGSGNIKLDGYTCTDYEKCLEVTEGEITIESFQKKVKDKMFSIARKIADVQALAPEEVEFINSAPGVPVYSLLEAAIPNKSIGTLWADPLIEQLKDYVALSYAAAFVQNSLKEARQALHHPQCNRNALVAEQVTKIEANSRLFLQTVYAELTKMELKATNSFLSFQEMVKHYRQLSSSYSNARNIYGKYSTTNKH